MLCFIITVMANVVIYKMIFLIKTCNIILSRKKITINLKRSLAHPFMSSINSIA
jgi:hypothetical protein